MQVQEVISMLVGKTMIVYLSYYSICYDNDTLYHLCQGRFVQLPTITVVLPVTWLKLGAASMIGLIVGACGLLSECSNLVEK